MFEQGVEQSAVGVAARVPHYENLKWRGLDKLQHIAVVGMLQVFHRLDVAQIFVFVFVD